MREPIMTPDERETSLRREHVPGGQSVFEVLDVVCGMHGVQVQPVLDGAQSPPIAAARRAAWAVHRHLTHATLRELAEVWGANYSGIGKALKQVPESIVREAVTRLAALREMRPAA